jgi:hypothetical protein
LNFKPSSRAPRLPSPPSRVLVLVVARRRASRIIGVRTAVSRADAALVADPRAVAVAPFASSIVSRRAPDPSRASFARSRVVVARSIVVDIAASARAASRSTSMTRRAVTRVAPRRARRPTARGDRPRAARRRRRRSSARSTAASREKK